MVTAGEGNWAKEGDGEVSGEAWQCQVPWVVHTSSTGAGEQALNSVHDVHDVHVHAVVPPAGAGQLPTSVEHQTWGQWQCYNETSAPCSVVTAVTPYLGCRCTAETSGTTGSGPGIYSKL